MKPENKITIRKKIAIISYGNCANLGDRIGQSIILRMIPYDCSVDFLYLPPFWNNKHGDNIYDFKASDKSFAVTSTIGITLS